MGIEAVKSSTPMVCRSKIKEALNIIMTQSDCSAYCDPQTYKTDGSAAGGASLASADTQAGVLCSQCTSQCGATASSSSETTPDASASATDGTASTTPDASASATDGTASATDASASANATATDPTVTGGGIRKRYRRKNEEGTSKKY